MASKAQTIVEAMIGSSYISSYDLTDRDGVTAWVSSQMTISQGQKITAPFYFSKASTTYADGVRTVVVEFTHNDYEDFVFSITMVTGAAQLDAVQGTVNDTYDMASGMVALIVDILWCAMYESAKFKESGDYSYDSETNTWS